MTYRMSENGDSSTQQPSLSPSWEEFFPYDEAYDAQRDGIETVRETADDNGFVQLEGACGTGKTLIALMAGIEAVRDPTSQYERVLCMTSVQQQLRAFEDDLQAINANLPEDVQPVGAMSMVGKADVCSYVETGHIDRSDIYSSCETLRDQVRGRVRRADDDLDELDEIIADWQTNSASSAVESDDWGTSYDDIDPMDDEAPVGCPFYAEYMRETRLGDDDEPVLDLDGVYTPGELVSKASAEGMCPHSAMIDSLENSEVLIGNYRHAFDPQTVQAMTGEILDDSTFVVCDEAHTMIEVVRDLRTEEVSLFTLDRALDTELDAVIDPEGTTQRNFRELVLDELTDLLDTSKGDAKRQTAIFRNMVVDLREELFDYADTACEEEFGDGWQRIVASGKNLPRNVEYPLRDPETIETDELTEWIRDTDYALWDNVGDFATVFAEAVKNASQRDDSMKTRVQTYADTVGQVMNYWLEADHETHFREIELDRRREEWNNPDRPWESWYNPKFAIKNCIPQDAISETLDQFGGGILMSATLEPFDAYRQETGLHKLDRPVQELSYGLDFPEDNRESLIADLEKFTYQNRGSPGEDNPTRRKYAQVARDVAATTEGNVLVGMPSYAEAEWISDELDDADEVDKPVLLDKSSTNEETEALKQDFFQGEGKVLITSMRGTLTEGVDYDGDRLSACVVCGLPIRDMRSPVATAIETAYKNRFGDFQGFAIGFAVPALRKARQALGRVIRSDDDVGVRVMADGRYASGYLRDYMPDYETADYRTIEPRNIRPTLNSFWRRRG